MGCRNIERHWIIRGTPIRSSSGANSLPAIVIPERGRHAVIVPSAFDLAIRRSTVDSPR